MRDLQKHVIRKQTPSQRKKGVLGYLYFCRKGEPQMKFVCQDVKDPEFQLEYALLLTGKKQRDLLNADEFWFYMLFGLKNAYLGK